MTRPPHTKHPSAALRHQLWWSALAVIVALSQPSTPQREWLAMLLHGAQLLAAPAAISLLLGRRGRSAQLACHAVLGQLYAGIQLSPALAALSASPLGMLGVDWASGAGPHRLACLLGLVAAYVWIAPGDAHAGTREPLQGATA